MAMPDLQRYLWKLCLIKYELNFNVFVPLKYLFSLLVSMTSAFLVYNKMQWRHTQRDKHLSC